MKNLNFIFSGVVQGVGFRYTVYHNALKYNVKGNVKNLSNSDVEANLEGEIENIYKVIDALRNYKIAKIDNIEVKENLICNYKKFEILY